MSKILVVSSKYHASSTNRYLTNDLVDELAKEVGKVFVISLGDKRCTRVRGNIDEEIIAVTSKIKYVKYLLLWPMLMCAFIKFLRKGEKIDRIIMFAPLTVMFPIIFCINKFLKSEKLVVVFDIFPIHQVEIGSVPRKISYFFKKAESFLLKGATRITAMGTNNKLEIQKYYGQNTVGQKVEILPLWCNAINIVYPQWLSDTENIKFVYGGQIIKGREINKIIEILTCLRKRGMAITLDFYSTGLDYEHLKNDYEGVDWIKFCGLASRNDYCNLLSQYHVGVVVTSESISMPTFPSKTLDYVAAGLPVFCMVETNTDLADISCQSELLFLNNFDLSEQSVKKLERYLLKLESFTENKWETELSFFQKYFSVEKTVEKICK